MCNGIERIPRGGCHNDEFVSFTDMSHSGPIAEVPCYVSL